MSQIPAKPAIGASGSLGEPAWEIAFLFPNQGEWTDEEYLALKTNHLIEFSDGSIEVRPMPTTSHQLIVMFLYRMLFAWAFARSTGAAVVAPIRVRLWAGKFREPDVLFMRTEHARRMGEEYWEGADLVMEVVSDDGRRRDLEVKRTEYARAGIPQYWIVDPRDGRISVLRLDGESYVLHGEFAPGEIARSASLEEFTVDVTATFGAAKRAS